MNGVILESFVLVNATVPTPVHTVQTVKFGSVMAEEYVTNVLPTKFLDVPAMLVGLEMIVQLRQWEFLFQFQHILLLKVSFYVFMGKIDEKIDFLNIVAFALKDK